MLEHEFRFRVRGDWPVTLQRVEADCGCTIPSLVRLSDTGQREVYETGTPLEPGSEVVMATRYFTRGKRGPA